MAQWQSICLACKGSGLDHYQLPKKCGNKKVGLYNRSGDTYPYRKQEPLYHCYQTHLTDKETTAWDGACEQAADHSVNPRDCGLQTPCIGHKPHIYRIPEKPRGPARLDGNQGTAWPCLEGGRGRFAKVQTTLAMKPGQREQMEPGQQMLTLFAVSICFSV